MRILVIHERFPPDFGGGGEYIMLETVRGLRSRGHHVHVLTTGDPSANDYNGIPITRLPVSRYQFNFKHNIGARMARDYDVILSAFYHGAFQSIRAAKLSGKPVVTVVLGLFLDAWKRMRPWPLGHAWKAWETYLLRLPFDRLAFLSEFSRQDGIALGAPADRSVVCAPGIDLAQYRPSQPKERVVLFSGKLEVRKGVNEVMEVARRLPDVRFRVLGWGPEEQRMRREAPPNLEVAGYALGEPGQALRKAFNDASIFFFPSHAETFGIVLVEAMASGCAIVSSVPLAFSGALVAPADLDGMTKAIRTLWDDEAMRQRLADENIARAKQYTWANYTHRLEAALADVLRAS